MALLAAILLSAVVGTLADHDEKTQLVCDHVAGNIRVSWDAVPDAERYDLHMGVPDEEKEFAGHLVDGNTTHVVAKHLRPGQRYWFRLHSHSQGSGWQTASKRFECKAPIGPRKMLREDSPRRRGYFVIDVIRMHGDFEGTMNDRDGANAEGAQYIVRKRGSGEWGRGLPSPCDLALYHIHVKKKNFTQNVQITPMKTKNGIHYANYMSCNNENKGGDPKQDVYQCYPIVHQDCQIFDLSDHECQKSQDVSAAIHHVGLGIIAGKDTHGPRIAEGEGRWYSLPKEGHTEGNWKFDEQYLKATCNAKMTVADIKKAFHIGALGHTYLQPWEVDEPAFSTSSKDEGSSSNATRSMII